MFATIINKNLATSVTALRTSILGLCLLLTGLNFSNQAVAGVIANITASDEQYSSHAARLADTRVGTVDADSWSNSTNAWQNRYYPMSAILDLGGLYELASLRFYAGQIPFPQSAEVSFEYTARPTPTGFQYLAGARSPSYDAWSTPIALNRLRARYVRVRFDSVTSRFNLTEIEIDGQRVDDVTPTDDQTDMRVTINNGVTTYGPGDATTYTVTVTNNGPSAGNGADVSITLPGQLNDVLWMCTGSGGAACVAGNGTASVRHRLDSFPAGGVITYTITATIAASATGPLSVNATVSSPANLTDVDPANNTATDTDNSATLPPLSDQPRPSVPGPDIVRSFGFGNWPSAHLSASCKDLHDRYWVQGPDAGRRTGPQHPDSLAYHTWHPAIATHPETQEACDFGHEHGYNPKHAPAEVFAMSGGWPAFGYAAEIAGGARHEDHVGHKVTVAHFRASIGNGAGDQTLYDAGFECDWLSKIHQGSFSMDAFSNHLHEYFLTLRCMDGLNNSGVMDGNTVGTVFSVRVMYTYGEPNKFTESNCSGETVYASNILTGPDGRRTPAAMQTTPLGNNEPNNRGFNCASGVLWKNLETEVPQVDLWTELIKIKRNDGATALTIQPYYIVKNPARIIQSFNAALGQIPTRVVRTIDLCYDGGGVRQNYAFCANAPSRLPADWIGWEDPRSPFNGTFRAINFKASHLENAAGTATFCTDAFGHEVQDTPPCDANHILQRAARFNNNWNNGRYTFNGRGGNVAGSIWAEDPKGNRFASTPNGSGGYVPAGLGFEFIIDNRQPDDDLDGIADGANIRGKN